MSRDSLFVIVEGVNNDSTFYDGICGSSSLAADGRYQVWPSVQANGGVGGKDGVLRMFDHCRRTRRLAFRNPASPIGRTALLFCLDKDLDDVVGGRRESPHVMYTKSTDVEAEIFRVGDDLKALKVGASLSHATAEQLVTDLGDWRARLADLLRPWIELCAVASYLSAHVRHVGMGGSSAVNGDSGFDATDSHRLHDLTRRVRAKSQYDAHATSRREARARRRIAAHYKRDTSWCLLRGQWMAGYLEHEVRRLLPKGARLRDFRKIIEKLYLATIEYEGEWADPYRKQIEIILSDSPLPAASSAPT